MSFQASIHSITERRTKFPKSLSDLTKTFHWFLLVKHRESESCYRLIYTIINVFCHNEITNDEVITFKKVFIIKGNDQSKRI